MMIKHSLHFRFSQVATRLLPVALVWLLMPGCGRIVAPEEPESFGLTKVELSLSSEYLGILNSHVFSRREVPAQFEIAGTRHNVLVRYSGQTSINRPKKSFTFTFPAGREFRGHRQYVLSAQTGDPTALHPTAGFLAFARAGLLTPAVEPAVLYLNGEYRGLYFLMEPVDEDFLRLRGRRLGSLYEARQAEAHFSFAGGYDVRLGFESKGVPEDFYGDLELLLRILDESTPAELPGRIEPLLEVENYLRYLAVSVLIHNFDGYYNNFRMYRAPGAGRFEFIPWDLDHTFERHPQRSTIRGANELSERLLAVPVYRARYREILSQLMEEWLPVEQLNAHLATMAAQLAPAYAADRFLSAAGVSILAHAALLQEFNLAWYAQLRQDLDSLR